YGEDLGLAPYYRDRPPLHAIAGSATAPTGSQSAAISSVTSVAIPAATAAAAPGRASGTPINVAPSPSASQNPAAASTILPIAAPSLFEAIERIAGDTLPRIREDIGDCTRCKLHKGRTKIVFGTGNPNAELMFVGEGP